MGNLMQKETKKQRKKRNGVRTKRGNFNVDDVFKLRKAESENLQSNRKSEHSDLKDWSLARLDDFPFFYIFTTFTV